MVHGKALRMNNRKEEGFVLSVGLVLGIFLIGLGVLLEMDMKKCYEIIYFIASAIVVLVLFIVIGIKVFSNKTEMKSWVVIGKDDLEKKSVDKKIVEKVIFCEDIENLNKDNLKDFANVKIIEFHGPITIKEKFFSKCKELEEVTFYDTMTNISPEAFDGCWNLKNVNLIGSKSSWKNFKIAVPKDCNINFIDNKTKMRIEPTEININVSHRIYLPGDMHPEKK